MDLGFKFNLLCKESDAKVKQNPPKNKKYKNQKTFPPLPPLPDSQMNVNEMQIAGEGNEEGCCCCTLRVSPSPLLLLLLLARAIVLVAAHITNLNKI